MRLGKRKPSTGLRIQLEDGVGSGHGGGEQVSSSPARHGSPQVQKRIRNTGPAAAAAIPVNNEESGASQNRRHATGRPGTPSNFANSGCLSPTDSPNLLSQSLKMAAERNQRKGKTLSESSVDGEPPSLDAAADDERDCIGDYVLLSKLDSAGVSYHALHTKTKTLKTCQIVNAAQLEHFMAVRQRLNGAQKEHPPAVIDPDAADRAAGSVDSIIAPGTEIVRHESRYYMFSPQSYGSLHSYVQGRKKLSEPEARKLYQQIVNMVAYCHCHGIVVRDLKLRKFVFADEAQTTLRMGSVNDVVVCTGDKDDAMEDRHGCPAYVSPEILDLQQKSYSGKAADMWSLGVLLFVMLLGRYPFYDMTPAGLFGKIRAGQFWIPNEENVSLEARLLLRGLLRRAADSRPDAVQLLRAPWFGRGAGKEAALDEQVVPDIPLPPAVIVSA